MLAPKSSHKRKRSSARSDKARKLGPSRWIVNLLPSTSQQASSRDGQSSSSNRRLEGLIDAHPFNRSLELLLPLASADDGAGLESSSALPASVQSLVDRLKNLASSHRSYRARIPLSMLLDPIFVTAYLKTGTLIALSDQSGAPGFNPLWRILFALTAKAQSFYRSARTHTKHSA